jgi:hypothetical protein
MVTLTTTVRFDNLPELAGRARQQGGINTRSAALAVKERIQESMAEPKSGEVYGAHQASAPGEAPAIEDRELVESIEAVKVEAYTWNVQSDAEHAPILEYGGVNMEARPFMGPAADATMPEFEESMKRLLD